MADLRRSGRCRPAGRRLDEVVDERVDALRAPVARAARAPPREGRRGRECRREAHRRCRG